MRFIKDYNENKNSFLNIDNILEEFGADFIAEGKVGDWIIHAPKVRKLQEKANAKRFEAVHLEARQRKKIDDAIEKGHTVDKTRMWELLQNKLDALEEMAKEYEQEAIDAAGGNEYLGKVRKVTRLKGVIKINSARISDAEREEQRELSKQNRNYKAVIRDDSKIINDKIKADKKTMSENKKKDSSTAYFNNKKAAELRK